MKKRLALILMCIILLCCSVASAATLNESNANKIFFTTADGSFNFSCCYPYSLKVCTVGNQMLQLDLNNHAISDMCITLSIDLDTEIDTSPEEKSAFQMAVIEYLADWIELFEPGSVVGQADYWSDDYHTALITYTVDGSTFLDGGFTGDYPGIYIAKILDLPIGPRLFLGAVVCPYESYMDMVPLLNQMLESGEYTEY